MRGDLSGGWEFESESERWARWDEVHEEKRRSSSASSLACVSSAT